MGGFLLRKLGAALVVLVLASMVVFLGVRALPGDPATALGAENRDPAVMAAVRAKYGLDDPVPIQYLHWAGRAIRGDLGSDQRQLSVAETIVQRIPITLELPLSHSSSAASSVPAPGSSPLSGAGSRRTTPRQRAPSRGSRSRTSGSG